MINDLKIYCIYHDELLINKYNLNNLPEYIKLLNVNNNIENTNNINYLNKYLCELVAYYYIWKNQIKSEYVGFCHYKRFYKNLGLNNLEKYGVHYYSYIGKHLNDFIDSHYVFNKYIFNKNNNIDKLYEYLCNYFNNDYLNRFFKNNELLYIPWKLCYIFKWEFFDSVCKLCFGFLDYIYPNYKTMNHKSRLIAWQFEIYFGIIIALYFNNIKLNNTNWDIHSNKIIYTESENKNDILNFIYKHLKYSVDIYILSNTLNKDNYEYEKSNDMFHSIYFIKNKNDIKNREIINLKINEYIDCKDYNDFIKNKYNIKII